MQRQEDQLQETQKKTQNSKAIIFERTCRASDIYKEVRKRYAKLDRNWTSTEAKLNTKRPTDGINIDDKCIELGTKTIAKSIRNRAGDAEASRVGHQEAKYIKNMKMVRTLEAILGPLSLKNQEIYIQKSMQTNIQFWCKNTPRMMPKWSRKFIIRTGLRKVLRIEVADGHDDGRSPQGISTTTTPEQTPRQTNKWVNHEHTNVMKCVWVDVAIWCVARFRNWVQHKDLPERAIWGALTSNFKLQIRFDKIRATACYIDPKMDFQFCWHNLVFVFEICAQI
jgi:hypothetical protein